MHGWKLGGVGELEEGRGRWVRWVLFILFIPLIPCILCVPFVPFISFVPSFLSSFLLSRIHAFTHSLFFQALLHSCIPSFHFIHQILLPLLFSCVLRPSIHSIVGNGGKENIMLEQW